MPFEHNTLSQLAWGVNLRGLTGGVNFRPGEAQDALDMLPREDGAAYKTFGWTRANDTALSGRPLACIGFTYRGKNNIVSGDTARGGNFGLADDGADFTRRSNEFSGFLVLTTTTCYRWEPSTEAFVSVSLPAGVAVDGNRKPVLKMVKENVYIVGWADFNLRYDPTDEALYRWGWESVPIAPGASASSGGSLVGTAEYAYAYAYVDVYTGEETALGAVSTATTTASNKTVDLTFAAYSGSRHFNDLAVATDSDVGIVVYRAGPDASETEGRRPFYFLTTLNPGTLSYSDTGDAVDTSLRPWQDTMEDEPNFSALEEFRGRFYALSNAKESNRMYYSDFIDAPFYERWKVRSYLDLPVTEGDTLQAIGATDATVIVHTRKGGYRVNVIETGSTPQHVPTRLPWEAGAVGPAARASRNGWEYWLSERGPYRWREGLLDPQWIGKPIYPLFIDPTSGLCKLSEGARGLAELSYEWFSNTMRFFFPIGGAEFPNEHWAYWIDAGEALGDPEASWWPQSPKAQCADLSHSIDKLDDEGKPVSPEDRLERFCFADADGYVYEYDLGNLRAGLRPGSLAKGYVRSGSTTSLLNVDGGIYTAGDGLKGMRIEVLDVSSGTSEVRTIASNTANTITPTEDFDTAFADGDVFYLAGIPAYWKSFPDHFGDPHVQKRMLHLYAGYVRGGTTVGKDDALLDYRVDFSVGAGEFPQSFKRTRSGQLDKYRKKMLVSLVGTFFVYEGRNFRPDEMFVLTNLQREYEPIPQRRRA